MKTEQDFNTWMSLIKKQHLEADKDVLQFIYNFNNMQYNSSDKKKSDIIIEGIYNQFANGYCYYFASILKTAFNRGEICIAAPFGHIVWVDENNVPYDICGCNDSECDFYIPVFMLGDMLKDFKHVPNDEHNTTSDEITALMTEWSNVVYTYHNSDKLRDANVICMTKEEATKWLNDTTNIDNDNVVKAKRKYLKLKYNRDAYEEKVSYTVSKKEVKIC